MSNKFVFASKSADERYDIGLQHLVASKEGTIGDICHDLGVSKATLKVHELIAEYLTRDEYRDLCERYSNSHAYALARVRAADSTKENKFRAGWGHNPSKVILKRAIKIEKESKRNVKPVPKSDVVEEVLVKLPGLDKSVALSALYKHQEIIRDAYIAQLIGSSDYSIYLVRFTHALSVLIGMELPEPYFSYGAKAESKVG